MIRAAVAVLFLLLAWWFFSAETEPQGDASLLVNRIWVQREPANDRDMVGHLIPIAVQGERLGVATLGSQWRQFMEFFTFSLDGTRLHMAFPQSNTTLDAQVRTWRCKGKAPKPFELCMEARVGRKHVRMFSMEDWVIDPNTGRSLSRDVTVPPLLPLAGDRSCDGCKEGVPDVLAPLLEAN